MGDDSEEQPSSSTTATSGSKNRHRARSATDPGQISNTSNLLNPLSSVRHPPTMPTPGSSYSPFDPFSFTNAPQQPSGSNIIFSPGQMSGIAHGNSSHMHVPGGNVYAGFPNLQSFPPQFSPHIDMWPYMSHQFSSFNAHSPGNLPRLSSPGAQEHSHHRAPGASPPRSASGQPASPIASMSQTPSPTATGQGQPFLDPEEGAILEDKRRRNTAASARFRVKRKQRTQSLEQTVSDLTSRAGELEREATDLRRENTWLKEMVIMKGRERFGGSHGSHGREPNSSDSEDGESGSSASENSDQSKGKKKKKSKSKGKETGNGKGKGKDKDKASKGKRGKK